MRASLALLSLALLAGCDTSDPVATAGARGGGTQFRGPAVAVGGGTATAFATILPTGRPTSIGVEMSAASLNDLPTAYSDERACYDKDGDGTVSMHECVVGHEYILDIPDQPGLPFQYVMLNYNPQGHIPAHVYDVPHFDIHFYIQDLAEVMAIDAGPCEVLVACDDYAQAKIPVPEAFAPPGYIDVDAVEPMMGNHLIDVTGPEFLGEPFDRTFIYGAYGGEITFYEPMITREYLLSRDKRCDSYPLPQAWATSGWYPTSYCTDYKQGNHRITLEDFVYRQAPADV